MVDVNKIVISFRRHMEKIFSLMYILVLFNSTVVAQGKYVAITMDDLFFAFSDLSIDKLEEANNKLLNSINDQNVPVTVFVNEKSFVKSNETDRRMDLLDQWFNNPLITIGNHTYSHLKYSDVDPVLFMDDVIKGESITKELLNKYGKELKYFRFPFNCTGKDSSSKELIYRCLEERGYTITPFTIESADYLYNSVYCEYLKQGKSQEAEKVLEDYIDFTLVLFDYFENVSQTLYGRNISHIYLCHTNLLNAAALPDLLHGLKEKGYTIISLTKALEDNVYRNKDYYNQPYGVSWIYRWIKNRDERIGLMKNEPVPAEIEEQYNRLFGEE